MGRNADCPCRAVDYGLIPLFISFALLAVFLYGAFHFFTSAPPAGDDASPPPTGQARGAGRVQR